MTKRPPPKSDQELWAEDYEQRMADLPGRAGDASPVAPDRPRQEVTRRVGGGAVIVLEVARTLRQPFVEEELTVACWERDRERFGLRGYQLLYPDRHRVRCYLFGSRGLIAAGGLKRVADSTYQVT